MKKFISRILPGIVALLFVGTATYAQSTRKISGTVTGSDSEILAGATLVTDSGQYSIADNKGVFELSVKEGEKVLVSYLGYEDFSFTPGPESTYPLVLQVSGINMLDETVVIGYGKTTKKEITGSVASLKADDMDLGSYTSAAGMLQGKVAGLTIVNPDGGDPNASYEFLLRGTNTLAAGQGPLIIIDGVVDADIRNINFQEVESVDVLKDGSAAAIYGTRGTNGVIIITTKRARAGFTKVEYDGQVSVQSVQSRATPMTAEEFTSTIQKYAPAASGQLYGESTDWFKEITRTPVSHKHSIAVSGGSERFSHRTVLNYEGNQGLQKGNDAKKYLIKTNISQSCIQGWLDLNYNLSYVRRDSSPANYGAFRQAFMHNPTEPVYDSTDVEHGGYYTITSMDYYNPVAMLKEREARNITDVINANVRATLNILAVKGLKWDNFVSFNNENYESREYRTQYYPSSIGKKGVAYIGNSRTSDFQYESTLQYSNTFGKHSIQGILGYTWQRYDYSDSSMENYQFDTDWFETNNMSAGAALKAGLADMNSYRESSRYIAFFGRVMYNYGEKYLASVSLRRDGSTKFGANHKWGWFPAVSLGWRMSQEDWLKDISWLDELKLRAGFGMTGNQDFSPYKSIMLMGPSGKFYSNGSWANSYAPVSNANPELGWEKKSEANVGLDFSFLGGRLSGTIDYYYRLTTDLLYDYNVPVPPYDYKTYFTNVGSISNTGIEMTIHGVPIKTEHFTWNTTLTASHNSNKLIKFTNEEFKDQDYKVGWLSDPIHAYSQRLTEGKSLGTFFGPVWDGVGEDGEDHFKNEFFGKVNEDEWEDLGSAYPIANLGWSNSFDIWNFTVSFSLRASLGGKVFNTYRAQYENISTIGLRNILASWLDDTSFKGSVKYSSKYIEDASFLKMDNLSLAYNIKLKNPYLTGIRVYLTGQNLFTLTGYKGVDPEVSLSGLAPGIESTSYYPRTRTFTLGVNLNF